MKTIKRLSRETNVISLPDQTDSHTGIISRKIAPMTVEMEKDFLYDQYTLPDSFPYESTVRKFQWDKIRRHLVFLDSIQQGNVRWGILQNYRNMNGKAPVVKVNHKNEYNSISDAFGVDQNQSVPLFFPDNRTVAERYGKDGSLVKYIADTAGFTKIDVISIEGEWLVPKKYIRPINDTVIFKKAIFVDRTNQNITVLEKVGAIWLIRSMNPATTGRRKPPFERATPTGIFVIQGKKGQMFFYKDGTTEIGGFAPYASRFSNGGYIHGVPVNLPHTEIIEYIPTLGTTPRSHMCVRNATSHARFIFDWAPVEETLVFVFD
ncbi:MAG: L,D-transpeptidase [Bacteroidales bacterium]|nr:L,D-transpeptidase [Bacteroidales bacterium]